MAMISTIVPRDVFSKTCSIARDGKYSSCVGVRQPRLGAMTHSSGSGKRRHRATRVSRGVAAFASDDRDAGKMLEEATMPDSPRALLVLAHGAGAGMHHPFMGDLSRALARHAIATMRWEFPYMREGRARPDSPAVAEAAVRRAWLAAADRFADLPRFAGRKSFGGRMTSRAHAAEPLPGLHGIVFFGFPLHPPDKPGIERAEHLASAAGPLLFVQGTRDELADLALLRPVVAGLGERARLHVIDGADHGFDVLRSSGCTREQAIEELARATGTWITEVLTLESARR